MTELAATPKRNLITLPRLNMYQKESLAGYLCVSIWVIGFLIFSLGPMIATAVLSFHRWDLIGTPRFIGIDNYAKLFQDDLFGQSLKVTVLYGLGRVPLGIAAGLLTALLLNQRVKLLGMWRVLYYMPVVLPPVAISLLWMWIYNPRYGILNGFLWNAFGIQGPAWLESTTWVLPSLMIMAVWSAMGRNMLIYLSGLQSISQDLYDAANVDGAGAWRKFLAITIPMLSPVIFFNLITGMIDTFKLFTQAYVMTNGGPRNASLFFYYYLFQNAFQRFKMGYASTMAVVVTILIMVLTILVFRTSKAWVYYEGELLEQNRG
ncbi:sugar ABC transporter permease [Chloroflexi bacterium TSY]|nr:sugar ABC transporter permease [Chloroflexi bacterium TSY]